VLPCSIIPSQISSTNEKNSTNPSSNRLNIDAEHPHPCLTTLKYITDQPFTPSHVIPMDAEYTREGIKLVGESNINCHKYLPSNTPLSLIEHFHTLDPALRRICGSVMFPPDDGGTTISEMQSNGNTLFGSSDASIKHQSTTHACTLSSGKITDLLNPMKFISGQGPIDGCPSSISSTRGEIQGQTALTIMLDLLLLHHSSNTRISLICDNKGSIKHCSTPLKASLRHHRKPMLVGNIT
jgi:hypothetical protein